MTRLENCNTDSDLELAQGWFELDRLRSSMRAYEDVDFNWITEQLAIGGVAYVPDTYEAMQRHGFTRVIDCTTGDPFRALRIERELAQLGIRYLNCYTDDDGARKPLEWFEPMLEFGVEALKDPNTRLLTHCAAGYNRGPSAGYFVLRASGMRIEDAYELITSRRYVGLAYAIDAEIALSKLGLKD